MEETATAPPTAEPEYRRRPLQNVVPRRYRIALQCLNEAMAATDLAWRHRIRAVELFCLLNGLEVGTPNRRDRRHAKELVCETSFQKQMKDRVHEGILSETSRKAKQAAEKRIAAELAVEAERQEQAEGERIRAIFTEAIMQSAEGADQVDLPA